MLGPPCQQSVLAFWPDQFLIGLCISQPRLRLKPCAKIVQAIGMWTVFRRLPMRSN